MSEKKLFLLDAFGLIYRAYYAFIKNPRVNSKGLNTSAPFGIANTLNDILKNQSPSHIAFVYDPPGPTFRHEMFKEYKANREEMPEDLRTSLPHVKEVVEAFNIHTIHSDGYEADDLVGTLAKQAAAEGFTVYMMTLDKDYCQLVDENIFMYKPKSFGNGIEILGIEEVKKKFAVENPLQVIDILGLWGDSSDNIPGAPGIGEKRAKDLIDRYKSIEGVYEHIEELKGKQKQNLIDFKDQIMLSKDLVTIRCDVPVQFDAETYKYNKPNREKITQVFTDLEFGTALQRTLKNFGLAPKADPQQPTLFDMFDEQESGEQEAQPTKVFEQYSADKQEYTLIDSEDGLEKLIVLMQNAERFCFDTETTSLDALNADIVGLSVAIEANKAFYVPFPAEFDEAKIKLEKFKPVFENASIGKIGQNLKYDMLILSRYGVNVEGKLFDTLIAHYLIQPEQRHNLDSLAEQYLDYKTIHIDELIGPKGKNQRSFREVPLDKACVYACEDADITLKLVPILEKELGEHNATKLFDEIETPLVSVLTQMEIEGVCVNTNFLKELSVEITKEIEQLTQKIYELAGTEFNIASPKQLGEILFEKLKVTEKAKKTKTKQYSTSEDVLQSLKDKHEIIPFILDFRSLKKLLSTYIDSLPELINKKTGRIHASFNQAVVATGRLSSNNPNLQNIPIKTDKGKEVRKAFIPSAEDRSFVSADYSQIELRVIAQFSQDPAFMQAFIEEQDIHAATASKIFGIPIEEITRDQRSQAKSANFGIVYGISSFGLSNNLSISRSDAKALIDGYFNAYPKVKEYMDESIRVAREKGYVETYFGRRRYLTDINSRNATVRGWAERNAINAPIQGTAADIIKIAMLNISNAMKERNMQSKMIMQVHDELNFDALNSEIDELKVLIKKEMESAVKFDIPLTVDVGSGKNWLEAH